ncbi:uncharacterized protein LOC134237398, partial [Saccostrea cucullata]|uniref:uncharacterized protein LOC134237398 n=1 Tax=Saccostrea cuccullata TaxID=36930 RepID=UPI002ED6973F
MAVPAVLEHLQKQKAVELITAVQPVVAGVSGARLATVPILVEMGGSTEQGRVLTLDLSTEAQIVLVCRPSPSPVDIVVNVQLTANGVVGVHTVLAVRLVDMVQQYDTGLVRIQRHYIEESRVMGVLQRRNRVTLLHAL